MTDIQNSMELEPIEYKKAPESVCEQIISNIKMKVLKPGDKLPSERKLMEQLKLSRPTVREALRMLEQRGFVESIPGRKGLFVVSPSSDTVTKSLKDVMDVKGISDKELVEVRGSLELQIALWALERRTEEDINDMDALLFSAEREVMDTDSYVEFDISFHQAMARSAHNKLAAIFVEMCNSLVSRSLFGMFERKNEEEGKQMKDNIILSHKAIFEAIRDQDENKAREAFKSHLRLFEDDLEKQEC